MTTIHIYLWILCHARSCQCRVVIRYLPFRPLTGVFAQEWGSKLTNFQVPTNDLELLASVYPKWRKAHKLRHFFLLRLHNLSKLGQVRTAKDQLCQKFKLFSEGPTTIYKCHTMSMINSHPKLKLFSEGQLPWMIYIANKKKTRTL